MLLPGVASGGGEAIQNKLQLFIKFPHFKAHLDWQRSEPLAAVGLVGHPLAVQVGEEIP